MLIAATLSLALSAQALGTAEVDRIQEAALVLQQIHAVPDKDVPRALWNRAQCVVVIPGLKKAAFIFGGEYGKGLVACRTDGGWSAPAFFKIQKGSWGLQIGGQSVDLVMLVMNQGGLDKLLRNKVTLGADASVAAGPVGRDARAATDAVMKAEILSYSRTQGLFAGIDISGGVMAPDEDANRNLYGRQIAAREILLESKVSSPDAAKAFMEALER
jgi:lipid-binding SYLF domain-containing protein